MFEISTIIKVVYYLLGFLSLLGILYGLGFKPNVLRERIRLNQRLRIKRYTKFLLKSELLKKYHFLLEISFKNYTVDSFYKILVVQTITFLVMSSIFFVIINDFFVSVVASLLFVFVIPIMLLYLRHKTIQNHIQNEIVEVSIILLQEYQKNHYHMIYALKEVVERTKGKSHETYARLFSRMLGDNETKKSGAELFSFQIGQVRGKNLSTLILRACKDGTNVTEMLEELVSDVTEFNKRKRTGETQARETAAIGFFPIFALIFLVIFNQTTFIPNGKAMEYQFQTPLGLKSFIFSVLCSVIGIVMFIVLKNPKKE